MNALLLEQFLIVTENYSDAGQACLLFGEASRLPVGRQVRHFATDGTDECRMNALLLERLLMVNGITQMAGQACRVNK